MKISVMGTGYVGLVSGVCLSSKDHNVVCVDMDKEKVARINNADPPIYEKGLEELLAQNLGKSLKATTDLKDSVINTDLSLIAVGTPFDGEEIDLSYVRAVATQIGEALKEKDGYHVVVVKSTVVPGTTDEVVLPALEAAAGKKAGEDFGVGMNPEFLREGEAINDFMYPDRIVLGGIDKKTRDVMGAVYSSFQDADVIKTNNKTAEMIKYTSNSLLATMISFSNEVGNLCASIGGIDVAEVMQGVHLDKRLSPITEDGERITPPFTTYIEAGCGFGGSCFSKDVKALIAHGKKVGRPMYLLDSVVAVNNAQPNEVLEILKRYFVSTKGVELSVLGLAFKPGTDDMRESPAIPIVQNLLNAGAKIRAYDPVAESEARKIFNSGDIEYCSDIAKSIKDSAAVILLTRWDEFYDVPEIIKDVNPNVLLIDGRRMLPKDSVARYEGIGL